MPVTPAARQIARTAALALAIALPLGACAGKKREPAPMTAIEASLLREQAMESLHEFAAAPDPLLRANAIEALSGSPSRVRDVAAAGLKDPNEGVRFAAAMVVGYDRLAALAPSVRPLLEDDSASVRAAAIFALVRCGKDVDRSPLAEILLRAPTAGDQANAAFVLGELGEESALALLRQALQDPMRRLPPAEVRLLRLQIAAAMAKLGDLDQLETVRAALYPSRPEELEATALAVQIMGEVHDHQAIDQLIYLTAYRERDQMMPAEIRLAAAASLAMLGHPQGSPIALSYAEHERAVIRVQAAHVLGETGLPENLHHLEKMLSDESALVRVMAASAILDITGRSALRADMATRG